MANLLDIFKQKVAQVVQAVTKPQPKKPAFVAPIPQSQVLKPTPARLLPKTTPKPTPKPVAKATVKPVAKAAPKVSLKPVTPTFKPNFTAPKPKAAAKSAVSVQPNFTPAKTSAPSAAPKPQPVKVLKQQAAKPNLLDVFKKKAVDTANAVGNLPLANIPAPFNKPVQLKVNDLSPTNYNTPIIGPMRKANNEQYMQDKLLEEHAKAIAKKYKMNWFDNPSKLPPRERDVMERNRQRQQAKSFEMVAGTVGGEGTIEKGVPPQIERAAGQEIPNLLHATETDPVKKIIGVLKEAKPVRGAQEALYTAERGKRLGQAVAIGEHTSGESGFYKQLGALKGQLPKAQFESVRPKVTQGDVDALFNQVKTHPQLSEWEKFTAGNGLVKLLSHEGGQVPTEGELKLLNRTFGNDFTKTVLSKRSTWQKVAKGAGEVLNLPRALMSTMDFSAPLRQGVTMVGRKQWWDSFGSMFKQFGSQKAYNAVQDTIRAKPSYDLMLQHGLALTDMGASLSGREEAFMSHLAEKIPLAGRMVKASERAYTGFLNKLRADTFDDLVKHAEQTGAIKDPNFLPSLTKFINNATGRGNLGKLEPAATALNSVFFSPRLMAARVNMLNPGTYVTMHPEVRKEALKTLLSFGAVAGSVLGLSKLGGAEVGTDPRSADFGKIKVGNTRYDILGGYQQYLRLGAQLATGKIISSTTGKEMTVGKGYKPLTRKDILSRFFENKTAPIASAILDTLRGQTSIGEPLDPKSMVMQRFIPMVTQDFADAYKEWGAKGIGMAVPSIFGASTQTYGGVPVNLQEAEQRGTVDLYRYLKTRPKAEANQYIQGLGPDKEAEYQKFQKFQELDKLGLSDPEYRMVGTGIKSGERALLITNELNKRKSKAEKNLYINNLYDAGIMTDDVYDQLANLKKQGRLQSPTDSLKSPLPDVGKRSSALLQSFVKPAYADEAKRVDAVVPPLARSNAKKTIPLVALALKKEGIYDKPTLAYALATIEHETAGTFQPIEEIGGRQQARKLGYSGGENYYGRGFIQLTHDYNYRDFGKRIGMGDKLVKNPELAKDPKVAARVLAAFFKDRGVAKYTKKGDFIDARGPINGTDKAQEISELAKKYMKKL